MSTTPSREERGPGEPLAKKAKLLQTPEDKARLKKSISLVPLKSLQKTALALATNEETAALEVLKDAIEEAGPFLLLLETTDIWVNGILPFVGVGNFVYVAGVSHRFKELYQVFFSTIKEPTMVGYRWKPIMTAATNTFYHAAFSSITCAEHWDDLTKNDNNRLKENVICETVARYGNPQVLGWAHLKSFPWDENTCANAAKGGHLGALKYAHENGCPWNSATCAKAAGNGHLDILKYAHQNGCPWEKTTCSRAALSGHFPWDENTCANAAKGGHLEALKYAHENGCPWNSATCAKAAGNGHLDILKYAHQNGCPWDETTCSRAALSGHLEVLKYAHENGCPWDSYTCANAATGGYMGILMWAREQDCPWDELTCCYAAVDGHLEVLKYAHDNGCPWGKICVPMLQKEDIWKFLSMPMRRDVRGMHGYVPLLPNMDIWKS